MELTNPKKGEGEGKGEGRGGKSGERKSCFFLCIWL